MPRRRLPSLEEARLILAERRTRPPRRAAPPAIKNLSKLIEGFEERFGQGADELRRRWREIAGEHLSARTEPVKMIKSRTGAGAILEIKVDGPTAAMIQHQAPQILARVNLFLGVGAVAKLRIVQGKVVAPSGSRSPSKAKRLKNQPLDAAREADLRAGLAKAPDGPLKASLYRLGREVMRSKADN